MRYFTYELWQKINSESEEERKAAEEIWKRNCQLYQQNFDEIKMQVPTRLRRILECNNWFHDWSLQEIKMSKKTKNRGGHGDVHLLVSKRDLRFQIKYSKVKTVSCNFNYELGRSNGLDDWGYSEFSKENELYLKHEVLFASGSKLSVIFKNISIENVSFNCKLQLVE